MKITPEKVQELAALSRLKFEGAAAEAMKQDLEKILDMCEKLNEVKTDGVEPLIYMSETRNLLREDEVQQNITHDEAMKNAPKKDSDFFRVPKVIGQTE